MTEDLDKELQREINWQKAIIGRRNKQCPSKKSHKRHTWNGREPMVEGWYCYGLESSK